MTLTSDVARRAHQHLWLVAVAALLTTGTSATWAWWPVQHAVSAPRQVTAISEHSAAVVIDGPAWDIRLWQPFTDVPVVTEESAPPLKLYSILKRNGAFIAALSAGEHAPMVYASAGDVVQGVTIRAVDATGVEVRSDLGDRRLELRP